uniref:Thiazole synthase n=1 Tax=Schizocladia ischiensis TaxID=196139 RepID=A0A7S6ZPA3_9STRA|nr:thiG [Schizocladia ischiensis]QOW07502.1 thiG [Schizocladia ischiensis]
MNIEDPINIAGKTFESRLIVGTGRYKDSYDAYSTIRNSGCEIVTLAVGRIKIGKKNSIEEELIDILDWKKLWILPNTAGARTAEEAIKLALLGRELTKQIGQPENNFVKLEVISDSQYLLPDPIGTLNAATFLIKKGFIVLPYINADPILAEHLQDIGCSSIMPLGSPIGSGQGIKNLSNIEIIIQKSKVPIIIDAGIGTSSDATLALEMGASAVLINTALAKASNPQVMAQAMNLAVKAGRKAYLAGRAPRFEGGYASPTSIKDIDLY